jgi:hypothetical protein
LYNSKYYFGGNSPVKETLLPTLLPESHSAEHPQTDFSLIDATFSTRLPERKKWDKADNSFMGKKGRNFRQILELVDRLFGDFSPQIDYFWRRSKSQSHAPFQGSKSRYNADSS